MRNIFIHVLLIFTAIACTKTNSSEALAPKAVVEGYLIEGEPIQVKVSEESITGTVDSPLVAISGLSLAVVNNGTSYTLNDMGNGLYSNSSLIATAGETYRL